MRMRSVVLSLLALVLPGAVGAYNLIIIRNFLMTLPESLEESAAIEGCNDAVIFYRIILPLSRPAMVTIGIFYAVGYWNLWFPAVIYINDKYKWPLQLLLRNVVQILDYARLGAVVDDAAMTPTAAITVKAATIIVTMLPIVAVYPFAQRYFMKGVMIGAVKG